MNYVDYHIWIILLTNLYEKLEQANEKHLYYICKSLKASEQLPEISKYAIPSY